MLMQSGPVERISLWERHLRGCIRALWETKVPEAFNMRALTHRGGLHSPSGLFEAVPQWPCGTPSCVIGYYAERQDLQDVLRIDPATGAVLVRYDFQRDDGSWARTWALLSTLGFEHLARLFGLTDSEISELFDGDGCGRAQNVTQAIAYIERFIERKCTTEELTA